MNKIPSSFLELLRERVLLSQVIQPYVKLTRKNKEYTGLCPFHQEKTPSFSVKDDKKFYHCFGCGAHGDGVDFLMKSRGLSFLEAVEKLALMAGLSLPTVSHEPTAQKNALDILYRIHRDTTDWFIEQEKSPSGQEARAYLEKRGLTPATCQAFQLGYAPPHRFALRDFLLKKGYELPDLLRSGVVTEKKGLIQDRFRHRLMFPITDRRGRVIAFGGRTLGEGIPKYLNSPDTPLFTKGDVLFGLLMAEKAVREKTCPLTVVEGYMDVISLFQAGFKGAVASLGTALTPAQMEMLWRLSPEPLLSFDGDEAGHRASFRAMERALPLLRPGYSFNFIELPAHEDPDSLVRKGGLKIWEDLLQTARPLQDVLWAAGLQGHRLDTPERRAGARQTLFQMLTPIKDPSLKQEYSQAMERKWLSLTRNSTNSLKKKGLSPVREKVSPPPTPALIQQRLLLALPLRYPELIQTICEDFAGLLFKFQPYEILKQKMISAFDSEKLLDPKELYSYLCKEGEKETLEDVLKPEVFLHGAIVRGSAELPEALKAWYEILERYQGQKLLWEDVQHAQQVFQKSMTPEAWERLRILKELSLSRQKESLLEDL